MDEKLQEGQTQTAADLQDSGTPADSPDISTDNGEPNEQQPASPLGEYETLLASLTEGGAADDQTAPAGQPRDASGRFVSAATTVAPEQTAQDTPAQSSQQPSGDPVVAKTPEQEDAELLASIQSERGRARVQQFISRAREAEGGLVAIREEVEKAGLTAQTFSQHLEFSKLANSNSPQDLQAAAQMLEDVRADIYRRLGQDAPTLDVLSAHPDLAQRVANLEMPREVALEVARMRHVTAEEQARQQVQIRQQQDAQQFQSDIAAAQTSLETYVASRQHEVDHPARMQAVQEYFANPSNLQSFAATYQPHQWPSAIRMLYENVRIASGQQQARPAPISSRPSTSGRPALPANASGADQIMRQIENMGLV